ncbi:hypothetical protein Tco_0365094 [Tanacetum coccineum]
MGFIVYQMDVKSAFLYGKIDEEVYVVSTSGFGRSLKYHKKDLQSSESSLCVYTKLPEPNEFYGRALFISLITGQTESGSVTPKTSHLNVVKRIFRYLKGKPKLGLWYLRVSSFDLEAYSDSDYAGANLDRKSTTGEKTNENAEFHDIIDFLTQRSIHYALIYDPSPGPSPTIPIPDPIPKGSGGNLGSQSSSDKSISGSEGGLTLKVSILAQDCQEKGPKRRRGLEDIKEAEHFHKKREKGSRIFRNAENAERPRTTSTRSVLTLKPLPKIDPNDKGKKGSK